MFSSPNASGVLSETHTPRDCALAIAIPATRERFESHLESSPPWDFVRSFIGSRHADFTLDTLWKRYQPLADRVREVSKSAADLGVSVVEPDAQGLAAAFREKRVVTLFAHWMEVHPACTVLEYEARSVLEVLMTSSYPGPRRVREVLGFEALGESVVSGIPGDRIADHLSRLLLSIPIRDLAAEHEATAQNEPICQSIGTRIRFRSREIQRIFAPGIFDVTARLELFDGHYTREGFTAAVPEDFNGLIDLAICHSRHLGDHIKRRRRCFVAMSVDPVPAFDRLIIQKGLFRYLAAGANYAKGLTEIMTRLLR